MPKRKPLAKPRRISKPRKQASKKSGKASSRVRRARKAKTPALRDIPIDLDYARRLFMVTRSVSSSARSTGVSKSRLRRLIRNFKLARWDKAKRKWKITDRVTREVGIATNGKSRSIVVRGFPRAQLAKAYTAAVKRFLETNDASVLAPFDGQAISDTRKNVYVLETRPNVLLRLANTGSDAEMKIYRLID